SSYYPLELMVGRHATDHNDLAFLFYVSLSFLALLTYLKTPKTKWTLAIGLCVGLAVLVKWLVGLVAIGVWVIVVLTSINSNKNSLVRILKHVALASLVALLVFIPWQIYTFYAFPTEAQIEMSYNSAHFFNSLEGHAEPWWYYFGSGLRRVYGKSLITRALLGASLLIYFIKARRNIPSRVALVSIAIIYLFFTVAQTKMAGFVAVVMPFVLIGIAILFTEMYEKVKARFQTNKYLKPAAMFLFSILVLFNFQFKNIQRNHTSNGRTGVTMRSEKLDELALFTKMRNELGNEHYVVFNLRSTKFGYVSAMFHTSYTVYRTLPSHKTLKSLHNEGYKIAIIDNGDLDESISNLKWIRVIKG
ncbi:MAG: glycosyltransferase family 39 protein, partial [Bacteroidetes bacterium]|nr:glycosyltransferase family 39 protein [Bacteroidota bacterium]